MVFDEGRETEPEHLIPIIPMTLVNGACGIANGFSTFVPQYNPLDIVTFLEKILRGEDTSEVKNITPWYRNYKGSIELMVEDTPEQKVLAMQSYGCYEEMRDRIVITELPVGTTGENYRKKLSEWRENFNQIRKQKMPGDKKNTADTRAIKDFNNLCKKNVMKFEIIGVDNPSYQGLGLVKRLGMTNMTLLDSVHGVREVGSEVTKGASLEPYIPRKFESIEEYMNAFVKIRLYYYSIRKNHLVSVKRNELVGLKAKHRFIKDVVEKLVDVFTWPESRILEKMSELGHAEALYSQTPIRRFCPEEVARLEEQIRIEEEKLQALLATEAVQIWLDELQEFREVYLKHYKGEDGVRKTQARKLKLVKVKKGTEITDDLMDLVNFKDFEHETEESEESPEETE